MLYISHRLLSGAITLVAVSAAHAQGTWRIDTRSATGAIAQISLPNEDGKRRVSFIAFEYARRCDPIFSFAEIAGSGFGKPINQSILNDTKIGTVVNGKFYTWNAAITSYDNGYEAGFGITNELFKVLTGRIESLIYIKPNGERVPLPSGGFSQAVQVAFDTCAKRFR